MLNLGKLVESGAKPVFIGERGGRDFRVEFDSSALIKLADGALGDALHAALDAKRSQIRQAAEVLIDHNFITRASDGADSVTVTALDLV